MTTTTTRRYLLNLDVDEWVMVQVALKNAVLAGDRQVYSSLMLKNMRVLLDGLERKAGQ